MSDLFPDAEVAVIEPKARSLDLRTEYLKERYNLHEEWVWHSFETIGDWPSKFALYKGGVYRTAIQRGKYKGRTNYRIAEPGTEAAVVLDDDAFEAWLPIWESRTGKCWECRGSGQKWIGWDSETGNKLIACPRCGTTGNAPASVDRSPHGQDAERLDAQHESAVPSETSADARTQSRNLSSNNSRKV